MLPLIPIGALSVWLRLVRTCVCLCVCLSVCVCAVPSCVVLSVSVFTWVCVALRSHVAHTRCTHTSCATLRRFSTRRRRRASL